ncbi:MAG: cytochrome c biogenesis protein ResB [Candidatus Zixiibacteriota bacterium]
MSRFGKGLWKFLTSLELAVVLVVLLAALMVVGALLPQGMDDEFYLKAWDVGTYHTLRDLGLLGIFHSAIFLVPAFLFAVNLLCCGINFLRGSTDAVGLRRAVSAVYHLIIFAMLVGFVATFLFSYGGEILIKPGESKRVPLDRGETAWARALGRLGLPAPTNTKSPYELRLQDFTTTYVERDGKVFVKDWISELEVVRFGEVVRAGRVEVNRPLVYGGMKYYQAYFDQEITFDVDGRPQTMGPGEPLILGKEMMMVSTVKAGTLLGEGGEADRPLGPYVELKEMPGDKWHRVTKDVRPGLKLERGVPAEVRGHAVTFTGFEESSGFTYKHDPAVRYLWVLWIAFMVLLSFRIYVLELAGGRGAGRRRGTE